MSSVAARGKACHKGFGSERHDVLCRTLQFTRVLEDHHPVAAFRDFVQDEIVSYRKQMKDQEVS